MFAHFSGTLAGRLRLGRRPVGGGPRTERSGARPRPVCLRHVGLRGLGHESGDAGKPIVVNKPDTAAAQALNQVARLVAARISVINLEE